MKKAATVSPRHTYPATTIHYGQVCTVLLYVLIGQDMHKA